jgi:hypothetical protein
MLNLDAITILSPVYLFLLVIGLLKGFFSRLRTGEGFLFSFCCFHYLILLLMVQNTTEWGEDGAVKAVYLAGRHLLPLLLMSIYWAGQGCLTIYQEVFDWVESRRLFLSLKPKQRSLMVAGTLLVFVIVAILPKTLKPQRYERLPEKWAGIWIKNQSEKGAAIFTNVTRLAYYTDQKCEYIDPTKSPVNEVKASMVKQEASYLVVLEEDVSSDPEKVKSLQKDFVEVIRFGRKGMKKIIIYQVIR